MVRRLQSKKMGLRIADLFCGAGGLSEGFASAGFEIAYGVDNDEDAVSTFHANHPRAHGEQADLSTLDRAALAERVRGVDVIVGGPCCQGFSTGGRRRKADWTARNGLWNHMLAAVELGKPSAFLLENVPGLELHADGKLHGSIITAFEDLGYVVTSGILLAANYGVPQLRRRMFVVGIRKKFGVEFKWPDPPYLGGWRRDTLDLWERLRVEQGKHRQLTVEDAIGDLPVIPSDSEGVPQRPYDGRRRVSAYAELMRRGSGSVRDHEVLVLADAHRELIEHVPAGGTWRDIPPHLRPGRFAGGMAPTDSTNLLGRLDPKRPAYTITTQFHNVTCGCFAHPTQNRGLSIREAARIQSFPDRYEFHGAIRTRRTLVGNAVPPLLAQHLACGIAEHLGVKKPDWPESALSLFEKAPTATSRVAEGQTRSPSRAAAKPEPLLAKALARQGLVFSQKVEPVALLGREVDILIEEARVAVFIDSCFWHGCPLHTRDTKSNTNWWRGKIDASRASAARAEDELKRHGYQVVRVWEHEDPELAASRVVEALKESAPSESVRPVA